MSLYIWWQCMHSSTPTSLSTQPSSASIPAFLRRFRKSLYVSLHGNLVVFAPFLVDLRWHRWHLCFCRLTSLWTRGGSISWASCQHVLHAIQRVGSTSPRLGDLHATLVFGNNRWWPPDDSYIFPTIDALNHTVSCYNGIARYWSASIPLVWFAVRQWTTQLWPIQRPAVHVRTPNADVRPKTS